MPPGVFFWIELKKDRECKKKIWQRFLYCRYTKYIKENILIDKQLPEKIKNGGLCDEEKCN
jgi:hypothetical protein